MNGFTQVIALAGDASAVAVAMMSTVGTPKSGPISVGTALLALGRAIDDDLHAVVGPVGPSGNVTSSGIDRDVAAA